MKNSLIIVKKKKNAFIKLTTGNEVLFFQDIKNYIDEESDDINKKFTS